MEMPLEMVGVFVDARHFAAVYVCYELRVVYVVGGKKTWALRKLSRPCGHDMSKVAVEKSIPAMPSTARVAQHWQRRRLDALLQALLFHPIRLCFAAIST